LSCSRVSSLNFEDPVAARRPSPAEVCGGKEANKSDYRMIDSSEHFRHVRRFYNM
jgi:hypothetical protein